MLLCPRRRVFIAADDQMPVDVAESWGWCGEHRPRDVAPPSVLLSERFGHQGDQGTRERRLAHRFGNDHRVFAGACPSGVRPGRGRVVTGWVFRVYPHRGLFGLPTFYVDTMAYESRGDCEKVRELLFPRSTEWDLQEVSMGSGWEPTSQVGRWRKRVGARHVE
jgi:hypothetical protein